MIRTMNHKVSYLKTVLSNLQFQKYLKNKGIDISSLACYTKVANSEYPNADGDFALITLKYQEYLKTFK